MALCTLFGRPGLTANLGNFLKPPKDPRRAMRVRIFTFEANLNVIKKSANAVEEFIEVGIEHK